MSVAAAKEVALSNWPRAAC